MADVCGHKTADGSPCENPAESCPWHDTEEAPDTGRPSKLSEDVIDDFVECIENGLSINMAADKIDVTKSTIYWWLEKAEIEPDSIYGKFKNAYDAVWYDEYDHQQHMKKVKQEHYSGENSSHWKGGRRDYRGPNWHIQRKKALERSNYSCESCGVTDKKHRQKHDYGLHVHHIVPRRNFADDDPEQNALSNLTVLCHQCHELYEGSNLSPIERVNV